MIMNRKAVLEQSGICVDTALGHFMGKDDMLEKFLKKFLDDSSFSELCTSVEQKDWDTAKRAAHTLKGICGTLGMLEMQTTSLEIEQYLKNAHYSQALDLLPKLEQLYHRTCTAILS
jgi:HPt (histidine-containing phosphotransfer) domain-containing protein